MRGKFDTYDSMLNAGQLPGWHAQKRMSVRQDEHLRIEPPAITKKAAVLIAIDPRPEAQIILIKRKAHEKDLHSGQISLPGGQMEEGDENLQATALREAHEEVGLSPDQVNIIGPLSQLYIPVSNFMVHPFAATLNGAYRLKPEPSEVDAILHFPIRSLFVEPVPTTDLKVRKEFILKDVPYFPLEEEIVWGATAMILSEFAHILRFNPNFAKSFNINTE